MSETVWNVRADQPYRTEDQAAADIANPQRKSYMALPTLLGAEAQHSMDNMNYAGQIQQQRQYAYDALHSKIAENLAKNTLEGTKLGIDNPGVLGYLAGNPTTMASFAGADPGATSVFNDWSSRMNAAKAAEALGKGAQGFLAGGIQMPPNYAAGVLPGSPAMTLGDPPLVAAAKVREAGAASRAGTSAGNPNDPNTKLVMTDPQGNTITLNKVPFSQTGKYLDAHYKNLGITAAPSASQHVGGGDANTAVPNLPMAQTDTPANNMSTTSGGRSTPATSLQPIPNNAQGTAIRNQIAQKIQGGGADKTALADVTAKGTMDVRHDPNSGAIYVIGQSGKPYRVQ